MATISTYTQSSMGSRPVEYRPVPLHGEIPLPGVSGILAPLTSLPDAYRGWKAAKKIGDKEGVIDNVFRAVQSFFSFSHAGTQIAFYALQTGVYLKLFSHPILPFLLYTSGPLACAITGLGLGVCVLAFVVEATGYINTRNFKEHICPDNYCDLTESFKNDCEELKKAFENAESDPEECEEAVAKFLQKARKIKLPKGASASLVRALNALQSNELDPLLCTDTVPKKQNLFSKKNMDELLGCALRVQTQILTHQLEKIRTIFFEISDREREEIQLYIDTARSLEHYSPEEKEAKKVELTEALLQKKYSTLTRRVHPRLAAEIKDKVTSLIGHLKANANRGPDYLEPHVQAAEQLMTAIKTQCTKQKLMHIFGMAAAVFGMAALIASIIGCPFLLIIILAGITFALAFARGAMAYGSMDLEGWNFSISDCVKGFIPEFIRNLPETIGDLPQTIINLPMSIEQSYEDLKKLLTQENIVEEMDEDIDREETTPSSGTNGNLSASNLPEVEFLAIGTGRR